MAKILLFILLSAYTMNAQISVNKIDTIKYYDEQKRLNQIVINKSDGENNIIQSTSKMKSRGKWVNMKKLENKCRSKNKLVEKVFSSLEKTKW